MHGYLGRRIQTEIEGSLQSFPAVALLGPRQCGKTTLAKELVARNSAATYLDLERPSDLRKLSDPELFFSLQRGQQREGLVCLDEIQRAPELFQVLRSVIDDSGRNGQFLFLGSASRDLMQQTSETLAGRIRYLELTPFLASETQASDTEHLPRLWLRGGFPRSYLSGSEEASRQWRESFIRSFLERDIPQLGFDIPATSLRRLWRMLAHLHGQLLNSSKLGASLGANHKTVRSWIDLLTQTFMVRLLEPLEANLKKRLVKAPKVYLRDSGILHSLLDIRDTEGLLGHPSVGDSWEGLVIENIVASFPGWEPSFYRTSHGAEIDLVLSRGRQRVAIECKASTAPTLSRGFWTALDDLGIEQAWVIAPVNDAYPLRKGVMVAPLPYFLERWEG